MWNWLDQDFKKQSFTIRKIKKVKYWLKQQMCRAAERQSNYNTHKILIHKNITRKDEIINAIQEVLSYLQWYRNYESERTIPSSEVLVINHVWSCIFSNPFLIKILNVIRNSWLLLSISCFPLHAVGPWILILHTVFNNFHTSLCLIKFTNSINSPR